MSNKAYIIAEAGVNHNGSIKMAHTLIEETLKTGADAIKFQLFNAENLVTRDAQKADYQKRTAPGSKNQYDLLKGLELSKSDFIELKSHCDDSGIDFLVTPFDRESLDFLLKIDIAAIKFSSGDLTFGPLLLRAGQSGKPVILSTGMATLDEIEDALAVLSYGNRYPGREPKSLDEIRSSYGYGCAEKEYLSSFVTILHCTSEYPAPIEEVNLKSMQTMVNQFKIPVGYSDHTEGITVSPLAVAMGACIIEKHITLDCTLSGPDHSASLEIHQFTEMVKKIRLVESIMGSSVKAASSVELKNKEIVRRGIYTNKEIEVGSMISSNDLSILRPYRGISPMFYWDMIGQCSSKAYKEYDPIIMFE